MEWAWLIVVLTVVCSVTGQLMDADNECDWNVWDNTEKQGVRSVHTQCTSGHIGWHHPYGAVSIFLHLPHNPSFILCFTATSQATTATISLETINQSGTIKLERLVTLDGTEGLGTVQEVCVESARGEEVQLYLEAEMNHESTVIGHILIEYDMEVMAKADGAQDDMEDCRPCTDEELLLAVCSSDFVVQGEMASVNHQPDFDETEIHLQVTKMHRQSLPLFQQHSLDTLQSPSSTVDSLSNNHQNSLHNIISTGSQLRTAHILHRKKSQSLSATYPQTSHSDNKKPMDKGYSGSVIAPYKCGIRKGKGQYLFMGRIRLKRAIMKCAPRVEDFEKMLRNAVQEGRHKCSFQI